MPQSELILYVIKLVLGGMAAFTAILLWSKTGEASWMCIIAAIVIGYGGTVYSLLVEMGILSVDRLKLGVIPLTSLIFAILPPLFYILGFGIMISRTNSGK
ncbi:hypothetical protein [Treponema sp.]|uniref:hypothetical protein n=1 Tax=Treponema sp. TaxID=166 RepID=UPI00388D0D89